MENYKTVSCDYLIQRIFQNHTVSNANWTLDAIEWVGSAIRLIGKHVGLQTLVKCEEVHNHHACYPCDMEGLIGIMYKGRMLPQGTDLSGGLVPITNVKDSTNIIFDNDFIVELNQKIAMQAQLVADYAITPTQELADRITEVGTDIAEMEAVGSRENQFTNRLKSTQGEYYNSHIDFIQTSFDSGKIYFIYKGLPLDDDGSPKIIDNEYYIQALEYYIILMMIQKGFQHPIFKWSDAYTLFYGDASKGIKGWRDKAANNVKLLSIDDAEKFARVWTRYRVNRSAPTLFNNRQEQVVGMKW